VTWSSAGRPRQKSVDRSDRPMCTSVHDRLGLRAGRPSRSTVQRALLSGSRPGRPGGRPARELCSLDPASVDRAVDRWHSDRKSDRWTVDRAVDRQQNFLLSLAQRLVFRMGYKYPSLWVALIKNFKSKFSHLLKCFSKKFSRVFGLKDFIFIWFKGFEKSKKRRVFGNWFWSSFIFLSRVFLKNFSLWFWFSNSLFSHTWAIISILSVGSFFVRKVVCGLREHQEL